MLTKGSFLHVHLWGRVDLRRYVGKWVGIWHFRAPAGDPEETGPPTLQSRASMYSWCFWLHRANVDLPGSHLPPAPPITVAMTAWGGTSTGQYQKPVPHMEGRGDLGSKWKGPWQDQPTSSELQLDISPEWRTTQGSANLHLPPPRRGCGGRTPLHPIRGLGPSSPPHPTAGPRHRHAHPWSGNREAKHSSSALVRA